MSDLENELEGLRIDKRTGIMHPAGQGWLRARKGIDRRGLVGGRLEWHIKNDGEAGLADVFEADRNFISSAGQIVRYVMRDQFLLQTLEQEVSAVSEKFCAVFLVPDVERIAFQHVDQLGEDVAAAVRYSGRDDGGRTQKTFAVETGEDRIGGGEHEGEAERKIVGRVARRGEEVFLDAKFAAAD